MTAVWVPNIGARVWSTGPDMKPKKGRKKSSVFGAQIWAKMGPKSSLFFGAQNWAPLLGPKTGASDGPKMGARIWSLGPKINPKIGSKNWSVGPKINPKMGPRNWSVFGTQNWAPFFGPI